MPSQVLTSVENNFTKGLVTEFTGLNFPENAATDCDNVDFTIVGDVVRRLGIDFEANSVAEVIDRTGVAVNTYKWNNVGEGTTELAVVQVGDTIYFYDITTSTTASPTSNNQLASTISLSDYNASADTTLACEFADGNGYLFIFHPSCDPIACEYASGTITGSPVTVSIRDFIGIQDNLTVNVRPTTLSDQHQYNLHNQGWVGDTTWAAFGTTAAALLFGSIAFTVQSGIVGISVSDPVILSGTGHYGIVPVSYTGAGTVVSYVGTTLTINITSISNAIPFGTINWTITPPSTGYIDTFFTALSYYPSNADQWWRFKNTSNVFAPGTVVDNTTLGIGEAPKGHYIMPAFTMDRTAVSGVSGITSVETTSRPTHGTWFQGRIWYSGVNGAQASTTYTYAYNWTENIYFSKIVTSPKDFGSCYQENDPTSETLFDLLPTDGGIITIQGCGPIYKLFPIQNGLLVFAANGVWFITGSDGIGFRANDYTITKISNVQSISSTSFVNVMGLPYFWNEEGIYQVAPKEQGALDVQPITVQTIRSFYEDIPLESKKFARAAYHPINYTIQWIYRSTNSSSVTEKYTFDKILNFNVFNKAFFPYTVDTTEGAINSILYISGPGGTNTVAPAFKYFSSAGTNTAFADTHNTDYEDWGATSFDSYFVTGYKLHGQAQRRFQIPYLYVYSRTNGEEMAYKIQSIWDFARSGNGGRWSSAQQVSYVDNVYQNNGVKRHRLRGHGLSLQIKISSVEGQPFDIIGWSAYEVQNMSV